MFADVAGAVAAAAGLSGRMFAGKVIAAEYVPLQVYLEAAPEAAEKL